MSSVRRIFRLREKSNLHEEAVQSRCDQKIVRVLRAQVRDLSSHLNEIEPVIVGHIRQIEVHTHVSDKRNRRAEYLGATAAPW
ncbi:hypothetical protein [Bradyrhizobium sp. AZCC 2230]|uniref:hypothetical protein n=1 Tax=Bradyrhizobium sp. AZCC 2230 TaxID=3117021 RepID=UPI002FF34F5B